MATLTITRTSEYVNMARDYGIYIDDLKVGKISNGENMEIVVEPGMHTIYAKIDWCYSPTLTFTIDQTGSTTFKVGAFKFATLFLIIPGFIISGSWALYKLVHVDYLLFLLLPVFSGMVYLLSIGR